MTPLATCARPTVSIWAAASSMAKGSRSTEFTTRLSSMGSWFWDESQWWLSSATASVSESGVTGTSSMAADSTRCTQVAIKRVPRVRAVQSLNVLAASSAMRVMSSTTTTEFSRCVSARVTASDRSASVVHWLRSTPNRAATKQTRSLTVLMCSALIQKRSFHPLVWNWWSR